VQPNIKRGRRILAVSKVDVLMVATPKRDARSAEIIGCCNYGPSHVGSIRYVGVFVVLYGSDSMLIIPSYRNVSLGSVLSFAISPFQHVFTKLRCIHIIATVNKLEVRSATSCF